MWFKHVWISFNQFLLTVLDLNLTSPSILPSEVLTRLYLKYIIFVTLDITSVLNLFLDLNARNRSLWQDQSVLQSLQRHRILRQKHLLMVQNRVKNLIRIFVCKRRISGCELFRGNIHIKILVKIIAFLIVFLLKIQSIEKLWRKLVIIFDDQSFFSSEISLMSPISHWIPGHKLVSTTIIVFGLV